MKIARVGYHVTGTGLVIAEAFEPFNSISKKKKEEEEEEKEELCKSIQFSTIKIKKLIAIDLLPLICIS